MYITMRKTNRIHFNFGKLEVNVIKKGAFTLKMKIMKSRIIRYNLKLTENDFIIFNK